MNYRIQSLKRILDNTAYIYSNSTAENVFTCADLGDTKHLSDFVIINNVTILSTIATGGVVWSIGDNAMQGTITKFVPDNNNMQVYFNNTRTNPVLLQNVTRVRVVTTDTVPTQASGSKGGFEALEKLILKNRPIRLENTIKASLPKNLTKFLINFFETYNEEKSTIYVDDREEQTDPGRRRSLGDIFMICRYYFPTVTLKEVVNNLIFILPEEMEEGFRTSACSQINKRVWYFDADQETEVCNSAYVDEYGNNWNWYKSKL